MYGSSMSTKPAMNNKPAMNKKAVMNKPKYPHDMFKVDKQVARTEKEHNKLEKMGYSHDKPKMTKMK